MGDRRAAGLVLSATAVGWLVACEAPSATRDAGATSDGAATTAPTASSRATAAATAFTPRSPCIEPLQDVQRERKEKQRLARDRDQELPPDVRKEDFHYHMDLDGDGTKDVVYIENKPVTFPTPKVYSRFYVRRGDCSHFVGNATSHAPLQLLDSSHNGLRDLRHRFAVCSESRTCSVTVRFDGSSYSLGGPHFSEAQMSCENRRCPLLPPQSAK